VRLHGELTAVSGFDAFGAIARLAGRFECAAGSRTDADEGRKRVDATSQASSAICRHPTGLIQLAEAYWIVGRTAFAGGICNAAIIVATEAVFAVGCSGTALAFAAQDRGRRTYAWVVASTFAAARVGRGLVASALKAVETVLAVGRAVAGLSDTAPDDRGVAIATSDETARRERDQTKKRPNN